jgi:hypothetical protein
VDPDPDTKGKVWFVMHSAITNKLWSIGESPRKIRESYSATDEKGRPVHDFYHAYDKLGQRVFLARYIKNLCFSFYRAEVLKVLRETNQV